MEKQVEEKQVVIECSSCGHDLFDGDFAYGTIMGQVSAEHFGLIPGEYETWEVVECSECYIQLDREFDKKEYADMKRKEAMGI